MILVIFSVVDQLFEVSNVLVDIRPAHLQAPQFIVGPKGFSRVQELGAELHYELIVGVSIVWLSEHPVTHETPP